MLKVTCALITDGENILTAQLGANSAHPFQWEFPGGKIKEGETAEDCIRREIGEELEVRIEIIQSLQSIIHDYDFRKIELLPFLCRIKSGEIKLNDHIAIKWVKPEDLQTLDLAGADKKLIQHVANMNILEKHFGKQVDNSR